jgi:hypothetical protein
LDFSDFFLEVFLIGYAKQSLMLSIGSTGNTAGSASLTWVSLSPKVKMSGASMFFVKAIDNWGGTPSKSVGLPT